jgi:glycosyltransferase involved in cell wall biosynthesis
MNILVFAPFYSPHIGGVESFSRDLHKELGKHGVEITVFTPHLPEKTSALEKGTEARIIRFPAWEIVKNYPMPKYFPFFLTRGFWQSFRSLWKIHPDIVISHTRFFNTSLLALTYAKIRKIPLLHIEHGSSFVQSGNLLTNTFARIYDKTFGKLVLKKANKVIAISKETKSFIGKLCPNIYCHVIHRGFDTSTINLIEEDLKNPKKQNIVRLLYIGRLVPGKGVHVLFEALKNVQEENWELFIVGDGSERVSLERLAEDFPRNTVQFFGEKKWEEGISLLKTTDIFINPSFTEGLPTTLAEAALCGKASIATDAGGTKELFTEASKHLLIPINNPIILAEKISQLIKDPSQRDIIGKNLKHHIEKEFSWDASTEEFLEIFKKLKNQK